MSLLINIVNFYLMIWICFYKNAITPTVIRNSSFTTQIKLKHNEENCTNCGIKLDKFG